MVFNGFDYFMSLSTNNENVFQVVMYHHSVVKIGIAIIGKLHVYPWSSTVMELKIVPIVEMKWIVCC
jgi:hypothetical protein